jgi:hypothetical protein
MESFDLVWIDIALKGRCLAAFSFRRCFPFFLDYLLGSIYNVRIELIDRAAGS